MIGHYLTSKLAQVEKQYNAVKHLNGTRPAYLKGQVDLLKELAEHESVQTKNVRPT